MGTMIKTDNNRQEYLSKVDRFEELFRNFILNNGTREETIEAARLEAELGYNQAFSSKIKVAREFD